MGIVRSWWCGCGLALAVLSPAGAEPLVGYTFTSNAPQASFIASGLMAGPVSLSSGSVSYNTANASSWIGPSGVPYVRGSSGWTAGSQETSRHFHFTVTGAGTAFSITNISLWWRRTAAGPSNVGVRVGVDVVHAVALPANTTLPVSIPVDLPNRTSMTVRIDGWGNSGTGSGEFQLDDILVEGVVVAPQAPLRPSSNLTALATGVSRMQFHWQPGDGQRRLLVLREGGAVESRPQPQTGYPADPVFGAGAEIGPGEFVVYDGGSETNVEVTGLSAGDGYAAALFEYNGMGGLAAYQTSVFAVVSGNTLSGETNLYGILRGHLEPALAVASGALWRITGGEWWPDGYETNVPPDVYSIEFKLVDGWMAPATTQMVVLAGATSEFTAIYRPYSRRVRLATYNLEVGLGAVGSEDYEATKAILARLDADIVAFQELRATSSNEWVQLADELGYSNRAWGVANGALSGGHFLGYFSRYPIADIHHVFSPPGANEMTRPPLRVSVAIPGLGGPLVLWTVHNKAGGFNTDAFRRAIEARRLVEDIEQYIAADTNRRHYAVLGDFNDDVNDFQAVSIATLPGDLPATYQLGADIAFPVDYHLYPSDRIGGAGDGLLRVSAVQQDGITDSTYYSGRMIDYLYISPALHEKQPPGYRAETFNAYWEGQYEGLPKSGQPLATNVSRLASDHYPVWVDLYLDETALLPPNLLVQGQGWQWVGDEGTWPASTQWVSLVNQSDSGIAWTSQHGSAWISVAPDHGWLPAGTSVVVGVMLDPVVAMWAGDTYAAAFTVRDRTFGAETVVTGRLVLLDGLDETWRAGWFGTPYPDAALLTREDDDADGDGYSNREEFIADTDPTQPGSYFGDFGWFQLGEDWYAFVSPASSNRVYMLERNRAGLDGEWEQVETGPGQGGWWYRLVGDRDSAESYYRVKVGLP